MYGAYQNNQPLVRLEFMKTIAKLLLYEHMSIRVTNHHLSHELRYSMRKVLGITEVLPPFEEKNGEKENLLYMYSKQKKKNSIHVPLLQETNLP